MSTMCRLTLVSRFRILSVVLFFAVELAGLRFACPAQSGSDDVPYSVGSWSETLGNHRARIQVGEKADAVWVHLPWRRHDRDPDKKNITIIDAATGRTIDNVARANVNRESADLVFQPATVPGEYFVYFAPFTITPGSDGCKSEYLPPKKTAQTDWLRRHGLMPAKIPQGDWQKFPQAKLVDFQARGEFERFDPMEVTATRAEMQKLLNDYPSPYLLFAEDRKHPIRMNDALPLRWIRSGPFTEFHGQADRNEYYAFQIGVYAAKTALNEIAVQFAELRSPQGGVISASRLCCINTTGVDYLGHPFQPVVSAPQGRVQALWCGVDVPRDAKPGEYAGTVFVSAKNVEGKTPMRLILTVTNDVREDRGDGQPWRHSRIRWLNSTLGIDDEPTPPYTPLAVEGRRIRCLGREIELAATGLPAQIRCGQRELLAAPLKFIVETADGPQPLAGGEPKFVKKNAGAVAWVSEGTAGPLKIRCRANMEFDGHVGVFLDCEALRAVDVKDIRLELPVRRSMAPYFMGIGRKGGRRPNAWAWKWNNEDPYDSFWIGDVPAGFQCELRGAAYCGPMITLYRPAPPATWSNGGRGGCTLSETGDIVLLRAYSGDRRIEPGNPVTFEFALLPTPVKPLDTAAHFRERYYHGHDGVEPAVRIGANVINIHHANEYNPFINYPYLANDRLHALVKEAHAHNIKLKIYYTVRELTNHATELWMFRSLGHDVLCPGSDGVGYPWLREHLVTDYAPAWYDHLRKDDPLTRFAGGMAPYDGGDVSAAVWTNGTTRLYNYYVEGVRWLVENIEIDGLYLDEVSYDRETLKRLRKVLARRPGCMIDLHSNVNFTHQPANQYMEFAPFLNRLWFGEAFDYNESPDYWLVEISGIPYGLMGDMLENGGNRWRGMVYGMTAQVPWRYDALAMWPVWDSFGIAESKMLGYWDAACPVRTDSPDVLATAYVRPGKTLVAVASWAKKPVQCRLAIDWKALGLDSAKAVLSAPAIGGFQPAGRFAPTDAIPIEPGKGWVLIVEEKK